MHGDEPLPHLQQPHFFGIFFRPDLLRFLKITRPNDADDPDPDEPPLEPTPDPEPAPEPPDPKPPFPDPEPELPPPDNKALIENNCLAYNKVRMD